MDLIEINPLLPVTVTAALYGLVILAKHHGQTILLGIAAVWLLVFSLAGGDALRAVQQMPSAQGKIICLGRVIVGGAPVNRTAGVESSACRYAGEGMERGSPDDVQRMIRANGRPPR